MIILTLNGCKDDPVTSYPGSLALHVHTLIDQVEVESYGDTLARTDGRQVTVTQAQLYISNIKLIKKDGGVVDAPSTVILIKQGIEDYEVGDVPSGNYKSIRFDIGLSDALNASTPVSTDLSLFQPSMWFGATAQPDGFVFVNFQGTVDTTTLGTGTDLIPFAYKIGTNDHRVTVTMPDQDYSVVQDLQTVVHINANYAKLLDVVPLNNISNLSITTAEENTWSWINQMVSKIPDMFTYEE